MRPATGVAKLESSQTLGWRVFLATTACVAYVRSKKKRIRKRETRRATLQLRADDMCDVKIDFFMFVGLFLYFLRCKLKVLEVLSLAFGRHFQNDAETCSLWPRLSLHVPGSQFAYYYY